MKQYGFNKRNFVNGCLLGIAELVSTEKLTSAGFGWHLGDIYRFKEPIEYKGQLGFFDVAFNDKIIKQIKDTVPLEEWNRIDILQNSLTSS